MTGSQIPTLQEELDRKALETLQSLDQRLQSGLMTQQDFCFALGVMADICQGLIDREVMTCISNYLAENSVSPMRTETQVFGRPANFSSLVLLHWDEAKSSTAFVQLGDAVVRKIKVSSFEEELSPTMASRADFDRKLVKVKDAGLISLGEML